MIDVAIPLVAVQCDAGHVSMTAAHVDPRSGDPVDPGRCLHVLDRGVCRSQLHVVGCAECGWPITADRWPSRHDSPDGWVHGECCTDCDLCDDEVEL